MLRIEGEGGNQVIRCRVSNPTKEMELEGEKLLGKWLIDDEGLSWWDYLEKYASKAAMDYMEEIQEAQLDAEQRGVLI